MNHSEIKKLPDEKKAINWVGALFLTLSPIAAILFTAMHLYLDGFIWEIWAVAILFYGMTASGITGGYHRYFAHRAYECRPWLKWYWALTGAAAFQNSVFVWARDHRMHHRFVDSDLDPYSIKKGFWWAHFGWMLFKETEHALTVAEPYGRDLKRDSVVKFQHDHYVALAIGLGLLLPTIIGGVFGSAFGGLAVIGFARIVALHHATFFINSACHWWGKQTYTDVNSARDSLIMAVATFGEGYHNFHHIFASDYRNGIRWYHWDPTKWIIQIFRMVGGAYSLRTTPQAEIIKAQLQMDAKRLKERIHPQWQMQVQTQLDSLKVRVEAAYTRFEQVREEYKRYKTISAEKMEEIREQLRQAKAEFREALRQWREYQTYVLRTVPVTS